VTGKVVVFGGSGFLGSHVSDRLSDLGYKTTIFDINRTSWHRDDQDLVIGDILDFEKVLEVVAGAKFVYNFAGLADLNKALTAPFETVDLNIKGNLNILESCRIQGVERFLYASTVYVHSREGGFYRCSKQAAEAYVKEYTHAFGIEHTILRFGSLYGPRADESNGMYRLIKEAVEESRITYRGHPESMREYIHVEDAARASVEAIDAEFCNQSIVLTGHEPMKVLDVLKMLAEVLNLPESSISFSDDLHTGHYIRTPYSYSPDVGRKYIPSMHVDLGQGLMQLIDDLNSRATQ
jgi:UDP-glucose 4-epimerase